MLAARLVPASSVSRCLDALCGTSIGFVGVVLGDHRIVVDLFVRFAVRGRRVVRACFWVFRVFRFVRSLPPFSLRFSSVSSVSIARRRLCATASFLPSFVVPLSLIPRSCSLLRCCGHSWSESLYLFAARSFFNFLRRVRVLVTSLSSLRVRRRHGLSSSNVGDLLLFLLFYSSLSPFFVAFWTC